MEKIQVGRLVNTHGLRGEVKVLSESHFKDERFKKGNKIFINDLEVTIKSYRRHKNFDLLVFEEFSNINDVEKFKGSKLYVNQDEVGELEDDEFYYFSLEGLKVIVAGEEIGKVVEVRENPGNDLLVIKTKNKRVLVPFVKEIVLGVDLDNKEIEVADLEGLF